MEKQILSFIKKRFPDEADWLRSNSYFFAQILANRFCGDVVYDPIDQHFLFLTYTRELYDWSGRKEYSKERKRQMFLWNEMSDMDSAKINRDGVWKEFVS